ncbi:hypothetical protein G5I_10139 [Acromyrmex echinatior]|uniref:Uncharacterized protein n=1 Tax=Acromyrmex echinatior TaxID=103372 RepID=F4WVY6_ACREC|nr:hypothetical protein G5I_10139 [Acromyrmex echinatior]
MTAVMSYANYTGHLAGAILLCTNAIVTLMEQKGSLCEWSRFYVTNNQVELAGYCSKKPGVSYELILFQQVARQVIGSLLLRLPPAGSQGLLGQRDATCAMIGQFAGRSKRQHIARSASATLVCRFEAERAILPAWYFSCLIRGDRYAHENTNDVVTQTRFELEPVLRIPEFTLAPRALLFKRTQDDAARRAPGLGADAGRLVEICFPVSIACAFQLCLRLFNLRDGVVAADPGEVTGAVSARVPLRMSYVENPLWSRARAAREKEEEGTMAQNTSNFTATLIKRSHGHVVVSPQEVSSSKIRGQNSSAVTLSKLPISALGLNGSSDTRIPSSRVRWECIFIGGTGADGGRDFAGATCHCFLRFPARNDCTRTAVCDVGRAYCVGIVGLRDAVAQTWLCWQRTWSRPLIDSLGALKVGLDPRMLAILFLQVNTKLVLEVTIDYFPDGGAVPAQHAEEKHSANNKRQHYKTLWLRYITRKEAKPKAIVRHHAYVIDSVFHSQFEQASP